MFPCCFSRKKKLHLFEFYDTHSWMMTTYQAYSTKSSESLTNILNTDECELYTLLCCDSLCSFANFYVNYQS